MKDDNRRSRTVTKKDIVRHIAAESNQNLATTAVWVDRVLGALREIMMRADPELRIEIRDFGVIEVKTTKSKPKARNPKSGELIYVPRRRKTHFRPGKLLKHFLSQPLDDGGSLPPPATTIADR